jgi:isopentenyl diphosphate isomerase/L-lactate dehydrogenase-like FMN-dependent dehydrogenase
LSLTTSTAAPTPEWTLRENSRVFDDVMFRPRSAVATPGIDLQTTVLGAAIDVPFILAPVGSSRLFYPRGEEVAARAAGDAGTIYTLSTLSQRCADRSTKRLRFSLSAVISSTICTIFQ